MDTFNSWESEDEMERYCGNKSEGTKPKKTGYPCQG